MHDVLFKHLELKIPLCREEKEMIAGFFTPKKIRKKQFLLVEGEICRYMAFVSSGLLKSYHTDEKGSEHITQFSLEGWWTSDMYAFFHYEASVYSIDAMEPSEVLLITREAFEQLTLQVPVTERYFRLLFQNSLIKKERRLVSSLSHTAEEKYRHLLLHDPKLADRIPQNLLASYLGLSPETISRLKRTILAGK